MPGQVSVQNRGAIVGAGPRACPLSLPRRAWYTNRAGTGAFPYEHWSTLLLNAYLGSGADPYSHPMIYYLYVGHPNKAGSNITHRPRAAGAAEPLYGHGIERAT